MSAKEEWARRQIAEDDAKQWAKEWSWKRDKERRAAYDRRPWWYKVITLGGIFD